MSSTSLHVLPLALAHSTTGGVEALPKHTTRVRKLALRWCTEIKGG